MRHRKKGRKLNRNPAHRRALLRNLACQLFDKGRIITTVAKARETAPLAEKLITTARKQSLHARRQVLSALGDRKVVAKLFAEIAPRYADRPGGYTRIIKGARKNAVSPHERPCVIHTARLGDNAPLAVLELVEAEAAAPKGKKPKVSAKKEKPKAEAKAESKKSDPK